MANKNWIIGLVVLLVLVSFGTFYAVTEFSVIGGDETYIRASSQEGLTFQTVNVYKEYLIDNNFEFITGVSVDDYFNIAEPKVIDGIVHVLIVEEADLQ